MNLNALKTFWKKLRISDPWNYKAPFLISVPYYMILVGNMPFPKAMAGFLYSCCTIIGIAGFAYLVNDYADIEKDRKAGKPNVADGMAKWKLNGLILLFLLMATVPWGVFFPLNKLTGGLLAFEFLLFVLYSAPPFRLKERGFLGVLADAMYAHVNPAILAAVTFYLLGDQDYTFLFLYLGVMGGWQLLLGIRNILLHMLEDYENDISSGTKTLIASTGPEPIEKLSKILIVPLEVILFFGFAIVLTLEIPFFLPAYLVFIAYTALKIKYKWKQPLPTEMRHRLYSFFDDFYVEYIPLLILVALSIQSPWFLVLLGLHLLLFNNALRSIYKVFVN